MQLNQVRILALLLLAGCATPPPAPDRWWKGNLHAHSLWSDGGDFPEMIAAWYHDQGYHFLSLTEHDILQTGDRWVDINAPDEGWPPRSKSARAALPAYRERFGALVEERTDGARHLVRLRRLAEYRGQFEARGRFLLIEGEEITDRGGAHVNAFNLDEAIKPQGGNNSAERTRNNLAAVAARRAAARRPMIAVVNHPNFVWTLKAEELAAIPAAGLFEVYNGHLLVNNAGDSIHPGTEQMWDVILAHRQATGGPPIYGVATDDAHDYRAYSDTISRPGRAWVMVRAPQLTAEHIVTALANGDFYASTGVTLRRLESDDRGIRIEIEARPNTSYRTVFVGARRSAGEAGEVLAEVTGDVAHYRFRGDERYVRATIHSSAPHIDPIGGNVLGRQRAWVQPVMR